MAVEMVWLLWIKKGLAAGGSVLSGGQVATDSRRRAGLAAGGAGIELAGVQEVLRGLAKVVVGQVRALQGRPGCSPGGLVRPHQSSQVAKVWVP